MYTYTTLAIIRLFTLALVVLLLGPIQALSPLSPAVAAASAEILGSGPLVQQGYLKAFNTDSNDEFGWSVALDGDTLVVSAFLEAGGTSGVNGDGADNSTQRAGAVYVFVREGALWRQQAYLKASNTDTQDFFGSSVAIDGDTLVVGATVESSRATGVGGDQADNLARGSGAAYVFVRVGGFWRQQAYLKASNTDTEDFFGSSVAIDGDTVVVGSTGEDSGATGANGAGADNSARQSGAAYVFVRTGATWSQQAYLKASNTDAADEFGFAVALTGNTLVVTAPFEDGSATGINGDQAANGAESAGAAYIFVREGTLWSQQAYLKASNTATFDRFGIAVAVDGDRLVVGATGEDSGATGVNGDQSDDSVGDSGAAYVFVRTGATWRQQAYLKASNADAGDWFGNSVTVNAETVVVGAPFEDGSAIGVNGNQADNTATDAGSVYALQVDLVPPSVTVERAPGQDDPTNRAPIQFAVTFSEPVTEFTAADVSLAGSAPGPLTAAVSGSGASYLISVSGMTGDGTVMLSVPAGAAQDAAGNLSLESTSATNSVTYDQTAPMVTLTRATGQANPARSIPILFTVSFSEPVRGFDAADVILGGTAAPNTVELFGSGTDYLILVSGMTGPGTVTVSIPAGAAQDGVGNASRAATSTDNSITFTPEASPSHVAIFLPLLQH